MEKAFDEAEVKWATRRTEAVSELARAGLLRGGFIGVGECSRYQRSLALVLESLTELHLVIRANTLRMPH